MRTLKSKRLMYLSLVLCLLCAVYLVSKTLPTLSVDDKTFYLSSAQYALEVTSAAHKLKETTTEEQVLAIQEAIKETDRAYRGLNTSSETQAVQKIMNELVLEAYRAVDAQQNYLITDSKTQQEAVQKHIENIEKHVAALDELLRSKRIQ